MILYPAIDLKDGVCVRLRRGDLDEATVFNDDPAAQAQAFAAAGFEWLHLVDLNGAFEGRPVNEDAVTAVLAATDSPVQLGGGIRDRATIEMWLSRGVRRVVLGTLALRNPALVREVASAYPGQIAVGLDAREGRVAVEGWAETSQRTVIDLARDFEDAGVAVLVHTDIGRDGVLTGVNVEATLALAQAVSIPVIASGGVAAVGDIEALRAHEGEGIEGAIVGRAFYDGGLDWKAALDAAGRAPC
ncbi:MAG TPA: 1-(5-phosphoribosyl)-5-[(5-phosphoribosylamino)methylideneamino]imidazole-4-carboxamide isomerase [Alphaproteobacteria bacterium]|nr:1-(5-phosphoribosyl)-5-[(5-phosphoribosylamino)methylideneamino]imidazole-4-carboxamide isomerase [Alphaproteobacteria bacterium]